MARKRNNISLHIPSSWRLECRVIHVVLHREQRGMPESRAWIKGPTKASLAVMDLELITFWIVTQSYRNYWVTTAPCSVGSVTFKGASDSEIEIDLPLSISECWNSLISKSAQLDSRREACSLQCDWLWWAFQLKPSRLRCEQRANMADFQNQQLGFDS